jgi:hypothetical protein
MASILFRGGLPPAILGEGGVWIIGFFYEVTIEDTKDKVE